MFFILRKALPQKKVLLVSSFGEVLTMIHLLPSPSGKVSLKATEGDNKSLLRFTFRFISPIVKISLNLDFATLPTERAPFVALRHFPRFIGEIYPEGESKSIRIRVNITLPSKISLPQAISLCNAKFHLPSGKYRCRNVGRRGVVPYG